MDEKLLGLPKVVLDRIQLEPDNQIVQIPKSCVKGRYMPLRSIHLNEKHTKHVLYELFQLRELQVNIQRDDLSKLDIKKLSCQFCKKVYDTPKKLECHISIKHCVETVKVRPIKKVRFSDVVEFIEMKQHRCRKCLKLFKSYRKLKRHMKSRHKKRKLYVCHYCSECFVERSLFKMHIKLHCEKCLRIFNRRVDLWHHVCKTMSKCVQCGDVYFDELAFNEHFYTHTKLNYICNCCHLAYLNKCRLAHHINYKRRCFSRIQNGYRCIYCDRAFEKVAEVLEHLGEATELVDVYKCDYCTKKFKLEKNLSRHMWSHFRDTVGYESKRLNDRKFTVASGNTVVKSVEFVRGTRRGSTGKDVDGSEKMLPHIKLKRTDVGKILNGVRTFGDSNGVEVAKSVDTVAVDSLVSDSRIGVKRATSFRTEPDSTTVNFGKCSSIFNNKKIHCELCNRYFQRSAELDVHLRDCHNNQVYKCSKCEEIFVWRRLMDTHCCIVDTMRSKGGRVDHFDNVRDLGSKLNFNEFDGSNLFVIHEVPIEF